MFEIGKNYFGFTLKNVEEIKDINSTLYEFIHDKTKGKIIFLQNEDTNKVFSYTFKTVPEDSTGVPHIIEHSVLCGSEKYPLKEPFVNLLKSSMNTFLNAMTSSDWTSYPVASVNEKDFKNLTDVYLDAVFNPLSMKDKKPFLQEGWHYELFNKEDPLIYKGVVYNEMKGDYGSVDSQLLNAIKKVLYKGSTYQYDSGGDPDVIPSLTYQDYQKFYHQHYNPTNGLAYFYGNVDILDRLEYLDKEYLSKFEYITPAEISIPHAQICECFEQKYAIGEDEEEADNTYYGLAYGMGKFDNFVDLSALQIVLSVLFSSNDAPLKKRLLASGLFNDCDFNISDDAIVPNIYFSFSKAKENSLEEITDCFNKALKEVLAEKVNREDLLARLNSAIFKRKESDFGRLSKGIVLSFDAIQCFNYDIPFSLGLNALATFEELKRRLDSNYYEELLEKMFLKSNHYARVILTPSKTLEAEKMALQKEKLAKVKEAMTDEEIEELIKENNELLAYQSHVDTKEEIATLPSLELSDIKSDVEFLDRKRAGNVIRHEMNLGGIAYLRMYFDLSQFTYEELPYVELAMKVTDELDTLTLSNNELTRLVKTYLGRFSFGSVVYANGNDNVVPKILVNASSLSENISYIEKVLNIAMNEFVFDEEKIKKFLEQSKDAFKSYIVGAGDQVAVSLASKSESLRAQLESATSGYNFYQFICDFIDNFSTEKVDKLKSIYARLFAKDNLIYSVSGSSEDMDHLSKIVDNLKYSNTNFEHRLESNLGEKNDLAIVIPAMINYNAVAFNLENLHSFDVKNNHDVAALRLAIHILRYDFLWSEVRVKGGAYGARINLTTDNVLTLSSYRDPNIKSTYETYQKIASYLENLEMDDNEFKSYVIGMFGSIDAPTSPSLAIATDDIRALLNIKNEDLLAVRKEMLNLKLDDLRCLSSMFKELASSNNKVTVGSKQEVEKYQFGKVVTFK